jgi:copper transport protein
VRALVVSAAGALLAVVASVGMAGPASAHALLVSTTPGDGAVVATQPTEVSLLFDDTVDVAGSTIHVLSDTGERVDSGPVAAAPGRTDTVAVPLKAGLAEGTYLVQWIVTSDDTHPVSGAFEFSVGKKSSITDFGGPGRNDPVGFALGVLRWVGYVGLALGPGLLLVVLLLWPEAVHDRRTRRMAFTGLGLLALSTVGGMLLQGVWASGAPLSALWQAPETLDTHSRKFDLVYAWRAFLLVAFAVAMALAFLSRSVPTLSRRLVLGAIGVSSVALVATWPVVGHSAVGSAPAIALLANLAHSLAMTVWLGGLAIVLFSLTAAGNDVALAVVLPRFSRLALWCAIVLVVSGVYMTWREVGGPGGLTSTEFGRVLLGKLAAVAVLFALGRTSQRWVGRNLPAVSESLPTESSAVSAVGGVDTDVAVTTTEAVGTLRRGVSAEIVVALLILAITSALVVVGPGR